MVEESKPAEQAVVDASKRNWADEDDDADQDDVEIGGTATVPQSAESVQQESAGPEG